jgi:hypothetical protein
VQLNLRNLSLITRWAGPLDFSKFRNIIIRDSLFLVCRREVSISSGVTAVIERVEPQQGVVPWFPREVTWAAEWCAKNSPILGCQCDWYQTLFFILKGNTTPDYVGITNILGKIQAIGMHGLPSLKKTKINKQTKKPTRVSKYLNK